jgi:hypothetical protein
MLTVYVVKILDYTLLPFAYFSVYSNSSMYLITEMGDIIRMVPSGNKKHNLDFGLFMFSYENEFAHLYGSSCLRLDMFSLEAKIWQ